MSKPLQARHEFVLLFDVKNGNPNGDPDSNNAPRQIFETGHGIITDVCIKRALRNMVELLHENKPPYEIYVKEKAVLNEQHERGHEQVGEELKKLGATNAKNITAVEKESMVTKWMCNNFFDIRTFGAVMTTGTKKAGAVTGPAQITFAESIDPINPIWNTVTRTSVAKRPSKNADNNDSEPQKNNSMGMKHIVPYALYRAHGFFSAFHAKQTGFSDSDLELFLTAIENMFEHSRTATKGEITVRGLYLFKHSSPLGNAPAQSLFEKIKVKRKGEGPIKSFNSYVVDVDENLPEGVILSRRVG